MTDKRDNNTPVAAITGAGAGRQHRSGARHSGCPAAACADEELDALRMRVAGLDGASSRA